MGQGLGDACRNHRTENFETACSQSWPQVLRGTVCQETPPMLPIHCYKELVPRYDATGETSSQNAQVLQRAETPRTTP